MIRKFGSTVLAAAVALVCAAPAGAATGFLADETLSPAQASDPVVAMAPNGYAAAAWIEVLVGPSIAVEVAVRPPGGAWSAPQQLRLGPNPKSGLDLAVDASGDAAVTWLERDVLPSQFVVVATRPAGGSFGAAEALPPTGGAPSIGIDGGGRATLLYGAGSDVVVRDFQAGASALAARPQTLAPGCQASAGLLDVASSGDAVAAWSCRGAVFALRRGGSWSPSPTIADSPCSSGSTFLQLPAMVDVDSQGHAAGVLFTEQVTCPSIPTAVRDEVRIVVPVAGSMQPVPGVVASGFPSFGAGVYVPRAVVAPTGILFTWGDTTTTVFGQGMARPFALDGAPAGPAQALGNGVAGTTMPVAAVAADGRALATWVQNEGGRLSVVVAERPPGAATFGSPLPVSSAAEVSGQAVATDDAGDGVIAWRQGSRPSLVHVRGYDGAPPVLAGVTIPSAAASGEALVFSAAATDVWSALTTSWSFGDGASADGGSVTHAYARDGMYTVTVTAVDALGNAVSRSGAVQVGAVGSSPPGGAPRLTNASLTHRRFRVGRRPTPLRGRAQASAQRRARGAPVGTTFRFTLDRAANVRIGFARQTRGVRNGDGDCVRPSRRLAGGRRCKLFVPDGTLVRSAPQGAVRIPFSGRVGRRALAPGRYRAGLTAAIGGRSAKPTVLTFRVVR